MAMTPRLTGPELQQRRRDAELTQHQLAERLGVSRQRIANVEQLHEPSRAAVRRILAAIAALEADWPS
jgi:transcriptional regulator with XRE-family HTH domain